MTEETSVPEEETALTEEAETIEEAGKIYQTATQILFFGLSANPEVNNLVRLATSGFASVDDIQDARRAVINASVIFYGEYKVQAIAEMIFETLFSYLDAF